MIVQRQTYVAKPGSADEVVRLAKEESEREGMSYRAYLALSGRRFRVVMEWEFASEAAREAFWEEWLAKPGSDAFMRRFYGLIDKMEMELLRVL